MTASLNSGKGITSKKGYCSNLDEVGWYDKNSNDSTQPVGLKKPNVWGIYVMHGNVWEWCRDWFGDYPTGSCTDPVGLCDGSYFGMRGGCWGDTPFCCTSWFRGGDNSDGCSFNGFRLALVPVHE